MGFNCLAGEAAVVPVVIGTAERLLCFNQRLYEEGVFANPVLPPAVPKNECLVRTSTMATNRREDLQEALDIFEKVGLELGVIGPDRERWDAHWAAISTALAV
jgi:8-amino-7-oxononanoate synthase